MHAVEEEEEDDDDDEEEEEEEEEEDEEAAAFLATLQSAMIAAEPYWKQMEPGNIFAPFSDGHLSTQ